ncbi:uncharacterized protein PAC_02257 [Phialocephala subalpina]|uniref:Nudix hydrolase domain-containing protein n=1 Tax=Phialocephala subalpina TaxID=576137 RepID=A0A1L7WHX2_9HELO|nr:uncharacterized protein PAC_02257 [Phialocephala subalpina]
MSTPDLPPINDRSYGVIPLRLLPTSTTTKPSTTNTHLLLISQKTLPPPNHPPGQPVPTFWCFPKGHPEKGDGPIEHTAVRELEEETSLRISVSDLIPLYDKEGNEIHLKERYTNPIRRKGKEVTYFLGLVPEGQEIKLQEKEVADARWVSWDEAIGLITFEECRSMLGVVREALDSGEGEGKVREKI